MSWQERLVVHAPPVRDRGAPSGLELGGDHGAFHSFSHNIHRRAMPYPGAGGVRSSELLGGRIIRCGCVQTEKIGGWIMQT